MEVTLTCFTLLGSCTSVLSIVYPFFSSSFIKFVRYRDHTECPVSACTCKCMQLDTTGNLVPSDSS